jgi:hypothetical protein
MSIAPELLTPNRCSVELGCMWLHIDQGEGLEQTMIHTCIRAR